MCSSCELSLCSSPLTPPALLRFLPQARGPASHLLLRKLLSICTGKCDLGSGQPLLLSLDGEKEGILEQAPTPAPCRTLRPRRPAAPPLLPKQQQQQRQQRQQPPRFARCKRPRDAEQPERRQQRQRPAEQPRPQRQTQPQPDAASSEQALCSDLLAIVRRERGVVLALALHAMHIWAQGSAARTQTCIAQGVIPVLLQVGERRPGREAGAPGCGRGCGAAAGQDAWNSGRHVDEGWAQHCTLQGAG